MTESSDRSLFPPAESPPSAALLTAWLAQSGDLLALTDNAGRIGWSNPAFDRATGLPAGATLLDLAPEETPCERARAALLAALRTGAIHGDALTLRHASGALLRLRARLGRVGADWLWTMTDITAQHAAAERALRDLQMLDMAQEFARFGVWERDLPSGRGRWDPQMFEVWGLDPAAGVPDFADLQSRVHPDDDLDAYLASVQKAGRYAHRYRAVRPDGSTRWIHARWEVRNGPDGTPARLTGIMVDETEIYRVARSIDTNSTMLKLIADLGKIVVWRHDLDTDLIHYNERGCEVLGIPYRPQGMTPEEARQAIHHDDLRKLMTSRELALLNDVPDDIEARFRRADGSWRHMLVRRAVERDAAGRAIAFVGVSLDVSDRYEALEALNSASERAALVARHAGIGIWETDETDPAHPREVWDEQMFHLRGLPPRAEALDRDERVALVHPEDLGVLVDVNLPLDVGDQALAYEFRVRLPDGSYRWLASRSAALHDAHGRVVKRVGVNWDVTENKSAEQARQQAELARRDSLAKSQFLSRMSHELRTPLNAVLGFTQLLQAQTHVAADTSHSAKLDHIRAAGEHLLALIDDALDLSNLQSGTLKLDLRPVGIAQVVARALPMLNALAASHRVSLRLARLEGSAQADPARLQQVLLNLLTNAIKYNRAGGEVVVESSRAGGALHLRVSDTGRGMRPEQLAHLFEPFNRLGMESEGIEGTGIGLTIAKALVEGMGGHIGVSSQPGQGTVFEVTLPAPAEPEAPAAPPTAPSGGAHETLQLFSERSGQLLYIEDNAVNVLLVEELVKSLEGLRIVSEPTGSAGVARALSLRPDLILVDMHLPDFDGFEVLRRLRAAPATAGTRCIALSANAMPEDIARGMAAGFDDYWTKPIQFKAFLEALERLFPA